MAQPLPLYAEIVKIDDDAHMVFGYASTDKRDQQGEIILKSAMEQALPNYMIFANIREMHQPSAVGTAKEAVADGKGLWLGAWIGDDRAWGKVKSKIYKGFSIGGRVTSRDPDDRSIITGIELSEISLVDRPANPDAVFQIIKRADGQLRPEPLQKWDCGIADHQHTTKSDAGSCMASELLKRCHDDVESGKEYGTGRIEGDITVNVELVSKTNPNLASGRFGSHGAKAQEHTAQSEAHTSQALAARTAEGKHRKLATKARNKGDAQGVAIHEHLAGASAALATQHDNAAEQHRKLAARHAAVTSKSAEEIEMTTRTVADALQDSTSAVALLASAIIVKGDEIDHAAEAKAAGIAFDTHKKLAGDFEKAASDGRVEASKGGGKGWAGDTLLVKAAEADLLAVHHYGLAKSYAELVAHYVADGSLEKSAVPEVKLPLPADFEKQATAHTELAKKATEAKKEDIAKHHTAIAEAYTTLAKASSPTAEQAKPGESAAAAARGDTDGDADDAVALAAKAAEEAAAAKLAEEEAAKGLTTKCEKCGAAVAKASPSCPGCGASMSKVEVALDAGGITGILKAALEKTTDEALKTILTTALGGMNGDEAKKAAEAAKAAEEAKVAEQVAKTAETAKQIETLTADRLTAIKALDTVTTAVKGMAKDVLGLQKRVKGQDDVISALKKQVASLENQPEPSRAKAFLATIRKGEDVGGGEILEGDEFLKRVREVPAGIERANFLLRQGYGGKR